jgi:hypothetical protein
MLTWPYIKSGYSCFDVACEPGWWVLNFGTPWGWYKCIETCMSDYNINIVKIKNIRILCIVSSNKICIQGARYLYWRFLLNFFDKFHYLLKSDTNKSLRMIYDPVSSFTKQKTCQAQRTRKLWRILNLLPGHKGTSPTSETSKSLKACRSVAKIRRNLTVCVVYNIKGTFQNIHIFISFISKLFRCL